MVVNVGQDRQCPRAQAKPYQVKQVRTIILKYGMGGGPDAL